MSPGTACHAPGTKHHQTSSRSHTDLQQHSSHHNKADEFCATQSKSDTDLFTRATKCDSNGVDDGNASLDQMSSEIDNILQGISSGHIASSPTNVLGDSNARRLSADKEHRKIYSIVNCLI